MVRRTYDKRYGIYTADLHIKLEPDMLARLSAWAKANLMSRAEAARIMIERELESENRP